MAMLTISEFVASFAYAVCYAGMLTILTMAILTY